MATKARRSAARTPGKAKSPFKAKRPTGADSPIRAKSPEDAWRDFRDSLAEALAVLGPDQYLVVSPKREPWFVQFAAQGSEGLRAEAVSNHYLDEASRLSRAQVAALSRVGWFPPTGAPGEATPHKQPDGSPNFFRDFPQPVPFGEVASLATDTLMRIFHIQHPAAMEYQAFERDKGPVLLPTLGLAARPQAPAPATSQGKGAAPARGEGHDYESVREVARKLVRAGMKDPELDYDDDGDLRARFGSAVAFVRPLKEPLCVRVFSPVIAGVEETPALLEKLNEINGNTRFARFLFNDGTVFAATEVPAAPLVPDHLDRAIAALGNMADEYDDQFQTEFGGRTAFGEFRPPPAPERRMGFKP